MNDIAKTIDTLERPFNVKSNKAHLKLLNLTIRIQWNYLHLTGTHIPSV
jgi:hypothetical protein